MISVRNTCISLAAIGLLASLANAGQIFTDRDAFLAAAGNGFALIHETFETAPLGLVPAGGVQLPAVQVQPRMPNSNQLYIVDGAHPLNVDGTRFVYADVRTMQPPFAFELSFSEPIYAFGAAFNSARSGRSLTLRDQTGDVLADLAQDWFGLGNGFFGLTLNQPVTAIQFTPGSGAGHEVEVFGMDNAVFAVVPEPATALLVATGLALLARRRDASR